jgi:hypothetical protein
MTLTTPVNGDIWQTAYGDEFAACVRRYVNYVPLADPAGLDWDH